MYPVASVYMCFNVCVLLCEYTFLWVGVGVCMCVCMHALECQCACLLPQQSIGHLWAGPVDNMHNCVLLLQSSDDCVLSKQLHFQCVHQTIIQSLCFGCLCLNEPSLHMHQAISTILHNYLHGICN